MTVLELIDKLKDMVKENPSLKKAKVEVEYNGGCETCGYGSEVTAELDKGRIYDMDRGRTSSEWYM
jgi:hypothetical protein